MNYLIGDIGNTNIKICKLNKKFKITKSFLFDTKDKQLLFQFKKKFNKILKGNINTKILFSSVVPSVYFQIKKFLKIKKFKPYEIKEFDLRKLMKFKVKNFNQLGSDRIANSFGVGEKLKSNYIIIDFGTATTFDILKKNNVYDGGIIAPGIKSSIKNLISSTALLPMFKLNKYPVNYGKNTKQALASGFFWGYQGLINNILSKIIKKNGKNCKIVLTGGYSYLFEKRLYKKAKIEKDITMQGIIKIYRNFLL